VGKTGEKSKIKVPVSLRGIRHELIDKLWQGAFMISIIGAPASSLRSIATGWLPLYTIHCLVALFVITIYLLRSYISFFYKSLLIIFLFAFIGVVGIFTMGVLGAATWWLIMSTFLVSTLYSLKAGRWAVLITALVIVLAGYAFSTGLLVVPVDANEYVKSAFSWVTLLIATTVMPFVVFQSISAFQYANLRLLNEVEKQRNQIEMMATHDQLTGLLLLYPANKMLEEALNRAQENSMSVAVLFIDLDGFKKVNDDLGHDTGDYVLKEAARRIDSNLIQAGFAARIGGDEFLVVIPDVTDVDHVKPVANSILSDLYDPYYYSGETITISASIGVSYFPVHGITPKQLRKSADLAMYKVKRAGKNNLDIAS
jgi:diguanylate cyclase (GGDEF)-like protein